MSFQDFNLPPLSQEAIAAFQGTPEVYQDILEYQQLYDRKLWHQVQLKIDECFNKQEFLQYEVARRFYDEFVLNVGLKINILRYAEYTCTVAKCFKDVQQAIHFLEDAVGRLELAKKMRTVPQLEHSIWYIKAVQAEMMISLGQLQRGKEVVEELVQLVRSSVKVEPSITARVYEAASSYHKTANNYADFYRTSLQYLCYVSANDLGDQQKLGLAVDIGLAALLGPGVYSFGELLLHPIVSALEGSQYEWLLHLLHSFTAGDIHRYEQLCSQYGTQLGQQPGLVANQRLLREKITIMSLLELVHSMPPEQRLIQLSSIGQRTKLDQDGVEFLLMKAASLKLLNARIDHVDAAVQVTWVQPRIMTIPQVKELKDKMDTWLNNVDKAYQLVEPQTAEFAEA